MIKSKRVFLVSSNYPHDDKPAKSSKGKNGFILLFLAERRGGGNIGQQVAELVAVGF
jgi:hypothetical protein